MSVQFCTNCGSRLVGTECTVCAAPAPAAFTPSVAVSPGMLPGSLQAPGNALPDALLRKPNWGALLFGWWWTLWNADTKTKLIAAACYFVGFLTFGLTSLVAAIYLCINGNRIAAKNRSFTSVEQFRAVQRAWAIWGVVLVIVGGITSLLLEVLAVALRSARTY